MSGIQHHRRVAIQNDYAKFLSEPAVAQSDCGTAYRHRLESPVFARLVAEDVAKIVARAASEGLRSGVERADPLAWRRRLFLRIGRDTAGGEGYGHGYG